MSDHTSVLGAAVVALEESPGELGAWLALGEALETIGEGAAASRCFAALGAAASELGQVGLAVACARWLDGAEGPEAAAALVDTIGATHCRGSDRIDRSSRPRPPAPPLPGKAAGPAPTSRAEALARAESAWTAAREAAAARAPARLPPTPLIHVLEAADFARLVAVMRLRRHRAGELVIDVGQPARALYWVAAGAVAVSRDDHELGELRGNAFFGEIALVGGTRRTARVRCAERTWLLEIPADSVEAAAVKAPKLARVLARYARARLLANVMRTSELFSRLDEGERAELLPRFETRLYAANERLIEEGGDNDSLYVVVSGRCEVREGGAAVAVLGVGDGAGEMSLLSRRPAIADVVATEPTVALRLSRAAFDHIAVEHPALLAEVYRLLLAREDANRDAIIHDADELIL